MYINSTSFLLLSPAKQRSPAMKYAMWRLRGGSLLCSCPTLPTRSGFGFRSCRMLTASGILVRIHDLLSFIDSLAFRLCAQFRRISVRRSARISLTGDLKNQGHAPSTYICQHSTTLPIPQILLVPLARHVSLPRALGYQIRWPTKRGSHGAKILMAQPASLPVSTPPQCKQPDHRDNHAHAPASDNVCREWPRIMRCAVSFYSTKAPQSN